MNGCATCGGFGDRHDPIAHGVASDGCPTCGHSTAPLWFGRPGSGEHSEDDGACITCGPELGKRCSNEDKCSCAGCWACSGHEPGCTCDRPLASGYAHGNPIVTHDGQTWVYADGSPFDESRPCTKCGAGTLDVDLPDPCLGWLPGVAFACCGHGVPGEEYVKTEDGVLYASVAEWRAGQNGAAAPPAEQQARCPQ